MSDDGALTSLGPGEPAAVVLYGGSDDGIVEDEQEWEYEYSTTQTEVLMDGFESCPCCTTELTVYLDLLPDYRALVPRVQSASEAARPSQDPRRPL